MERAAEGEIAAADAPVNGLTRANGTAAALQEYRLAGSVWATGFDRNIE